MKLLRKLTAFILAFGLLAGTVAAVSAAVFVDTAVPASGYAAAVSGHMDDPDAAAVGADSGYVPRLTAPSHDNPYYYSDQNVFYRYGWGMPNCTCYAWGRAYEILGTAPDLCVYSAYLWYDYNIENGSYAYGTEPRLGAIACWVYSSGTSGHVAVVEKIENDVITFSNSAYGGEEFYTSTAPLDDPTGGNDYWVFQGYIYLIDAIGSASDDPSGDEPPAEEPTDPASGVDAPTEGIVYRITTDGGVNLRSGPGTSYSVVGFIATGECAAVTETQDADGYCWGHTEYQGVSGWFALDYAEPVESAPAPSPEDPAEEPTQPGDDPAPARDVTMGDVDGDGKVTILDATRIQLIIAEMFTPTRYMLMAGDYDGDSIFSIMDAGRIRHDIAFGVVGAPAT